MITVSELTTPDIKQMINILQDELDKRQRARRAELINQFKQAYWALRDEGMSIQYDTHEYDVFLDDFERFWFT
jgi:hypothetical protein